VTGPGAQRDDALGRDVRAQLGQRLGQRRDVRVVVLLGLGDERGAAQRQELAGVGVGRDLYLQQHRGEYLGLLHF
jgi:hypothetical protein